MIEMMEGEGWGIMNGIKEGDEEGEFTYTGGRGESVIDYVIGDSKTWEAVEEITVGDNTESDHQPLIVRLGAGGKEGREVVKEGERWVMDWSEESREEYRREMEGEEIKGETVEEVLRGLKETVKRKAIWRKVGRKREGKRWWDGECRNRKKEVKGALRRWRRGEGTGEEYRKRKGEYRRVCEEKREQERKRFVEEIEKVDGEGKVWEILRRERGRRKKVNGSIQMEEWKRHFMEVLGGREERVGREWGKETRNREQVEEIGVEEVREILKELKKGKAVGVDGMPNEAWMYGGENVVRAVWRISNGVWMEEGWPEEWKEGVIVPIAKKGKGEGTRDHRGVTLMPSLYKVYMKLLAKKLEREIEEKGIVPDNQAGFRRGRGVMEQIYSRKLYYREADK